MLAGVHSAFTWLTVLPLPAPRGDVDRRLGARAIAATPLVGALLGALAAALAWALTLTALPAAAVGFLVVGALALGTRGMHVDGLADCADGLGCYGGPERAREVMTSGPAGPFAAATLVVVLGVQAVCFGELATRGDWAAVALVIATSRVSPVLACRRGWDATPGAGFGRLVAGTQGPLTLVTWPVLALTAAFPLGLPAVGAVAGGLVAGFGFTAHCRRRFSGISGDALGGAIELSLTVALVVLAATPI